MSYDIRMKNCRFIIKHENFDKALADLKAVFVPENMTAYDRTKDNVKHMHFDWINTEPVLKSNTLDDALRHIRYIPVYDYDRNIESLEFTGEKLGDETLLFGSIAKYVEPGSFIECFGEDGRELKWTFENGQIKYEGPANL